MDPFVKVVRELHSASVRFVVIGVWGVNYYACSGVTLFTTHDRDLFLPADPANLSAAWDACESTGLGLWAGSEPLDSPRDDTLAQAVIDRRALTSASDGEGLQLDLTLVMSGFDFETVLAESRMFVVDEISVPVAALPHIIASKQAAGREKDKLFLETHKAALRQMLGEDS